MLFLFCHVVVLAVLQLPTSLAVYTFPEIYLQARNSGGIKAFLPDSCGVQGFGFQIKPKNETSWKTGNGTREDRFWTFQDRSARPRPGDEYEYAARVWHQGSRYSYPITSWYVPDLVDDYSYPPLLESEENCLSEEEEEEDPKEQFFDPRLRPSVRQPKTFTTTTTPQTTTTSEATTTTPTTTPTATTTTTTTKRPSPQPKALQPEKTRTPPEEQQTPPTGPTFSLSCNWLEPPNRAMSKEEVLERQLAMLQCEMSSFLERTTKLTAELNRELLDLKKLNYATVARMQRLESLIRTIPRAVPYSFL